MQAAVISWAETDDAIQRITAPTRTPTLTTSPPALRSGLAIPAWRLITLLLSALKYFATLSGQRRTAYFDTLPSTIVDHTIIIYKCHALNTPYMHDLQGPLVSKIAVPQTSVHGEESFSASQLQDSAAKYGFSHDSWDSG